MNKAIKILGTGCPKCQTLNNIVLDVVKENNIDASVEKVEDIMKIMEYNIMATPALVVDEKVVLKGRTPSKNEVLQLLKSEGVTTKDNPNKSCCS